MSRAQFLYYILKWWMHILSVYNDACNEHLHTDRPPIYNKWNVKQPITWLRSARSIELSEIPMNVNVITSVNAFRKKEKAICRVGQTAFIRVLRCFQLPAYTRWVGFSPLCQLRERLVICQWQKSTVDWLPNNIQWFLNFAAPIVLFYVTNSTHLAPVWDKTNS